MPRFVERLDDRCEASSSSSGSSSSGKRSRDDRRASDASLSTDEVCRRIRKKLAVSFDQAVPVAAHHAALTHVCTLRDALVAGKTLAPDARMHLVNTGVALARRVFLAIETDEAAAAMHTTIGMLFFLVSFTLDGVADSDDEMEEAPAPTGTTDAVSDASPDASPAASAALLVKHWKERSIAELHCSDDDFSPARMCRALMELGPNVPLAELVQHGLDFFQSTANLMVERAINAAVEPKMDFLTLSASSVLMQVDDDQRDARLTALCEAAESEAGQTAFRDLILSFTLPRSVVGTRRSVLMTRAANKLATKDFPLVLNDAHEVRTECVVQLCIPLLTFVVFLMWCVTRWR